MSIKKSLLVWATVTSSVMIGCSKNSGSGATAANGTYVSGYAATGAAIAGGQVDLVDAEGNQASSVTTSSDGSYRIDVSGKTLPYILKVTTSTGKEYMSALADESKLNSTINISPLTHTVVARMLGETDPTEAFRKAKLADGASGKIDLNAKVTTTNMNTQAQAINTALANVIAAVDTSNTSHNYDFFNGSFVPGSGQKMDALLDAIKIDSTDASKIVIKLKADETKAIEVPKDTTSSIGNALSSSDVSTVSTQISALGEIKTRMSSFADAVKNSCASSGVVSDSFFDSSYMNDGENKSAFNTLIWEEECEQDSSAILPISFTNVNIEKYNTTDNTVEITYDIISDGTIVSKGEKNILKKVSGVWKLYGNQFPYSISVFPRTSVISNYSFNSNNVGSSLADSTETGLDFYLDAENCTSISGHTLTLTYGSTTITLKCSDQFGGGAQLYISGKLYTDGDGNYSDTAQTGYYLNPRSSSYQMDFSTLGAETAMTLSWNSKSKSIKVNKPDTSKSLDFNKTASQLCSGTSAPSYGFTKPSGSEVKNSMISFDYKTTLNATPVFASNFSFDETGDGITIGALPASSIPSNAQFTYKSFMASAYDDFNRVYTKVLNCTGYNFDANANTTSNNSSIAYLAASAFNHTWTYNSDHSIAATISISGSNGSYSGTFSGTAAGDPDANTVTSGSCYITITQTTNSSGTMTASGCTYSTNNGTENWSITGNSITIGGDTFSY